MAPERLEVLSIFHADDVVGCDRFLDRYGRREFLLGRFRHPAVQRCCVHIRNELGQVIPADGVVFYQRRNDFRCECDMV